MPRLLAPLLVVTAVAAGGAARAGDPPPPPAAVAPARAPDRVDALFEQATAAYDAKRLPEAEVKLAEAWGIRQTFDIAGNLGVVELKLGKPAQAAGHLTWALQHFPPSQSERQRAGYQKDLEAARAQCAALRLRVSVAGTEVAVGGRVVGVSPFEDEVFVDAGGVVIEARREGFVTVRQAVTLAKGEAREVALVLAPEVAAPAAAKRPLWPVVVGGVLATGGLAAGTGLTVAANGKAADVARLRSGQSTTCFMPDQNLAASCAALHDAVSKRATFSSAAVSSFLVGGAFAAASAGLGIWVAASPRVATVRVAPILGAAQVGVMVGGGW